MLIQLDESDYDAANDIARSEGMSFAGLVRRLIKLCLRDAVKPRKRKPKV